MSNLMGLPIELVQWILRDVDDPCICQYVCRSWRDASGQLQAIHILTYISVLSERGHFHLLRWARKQGFPWHRRAARSLSTYGNIKMLQWACDAGCSTHWITARHVNVIRWLEKAPGGVSLTPLDLRRAAKRGDVALFELIARYSGKYTAVIFCLSLNDKIAIVKHWLRYGRTDILEKWDLCGQMGTDNTPNRHCDIPVRYLSWAVSKECDFSHNHTVTRNIVQRGSLALYKKWEHICNAAVALEESFEHGQHDIAAYIMSKGVLPTIRCVDAMMRAYDLEWVKKCDHTVDAFTIQQAILGAARHNDTTGLDLLYDRSNGWGWSASAYNAAIAAENMNILEWLHRHDVLLSSQAYVEATRVGNTTILDWIHKRIDTRATPYGWCRLAFKRGRIDIVLWFLERGFRLEEEAFCMVAKKYNTAAMAWFHSRSEIAQDTIIAAVEAARKHGKQANTEWLSTCKAAPAHFDPGLYCEATDSAESQIKPDSGSAESNISIQYVVVPTLNERRCIGAIHFRDAAECRLEIHGVPIGKIRGNDYLFDLRKLWRNTLRIERLHPNQQTQEGVFFIVANEVDDDSELNYRRNPKGIRARQIGSINVRGVIGKNFEYEVIYNP